MAVNHQEITLLKRTSIMPKESLPSLLVRLAAMNYYDSHNLLIQLIRERISNGDKVELPRQVATYDEIAALSGIPPVEIAMSSSHYFASVLTPPDSSMELLKVTDEVTFPLLSPGCAAKQLRPIQASQYCPRCLGESAYHRLIWTPIAVSACLQHCCLLLHLCPGCQNSITVQDIVEAQCRTCSMNLAEAETLVLDNDEWGIFCQRLIQSWLMQNSFSVSICLLEQTPQVLYRVVDGLHWATRILAKTNWSYLYYSPKISQLYEQQFQHKAVGSIIPYESYCLYATACKGIANWPHGFYDFLEAYSAQIKKTAPSHGGPKADLGNLYVQWLQEYWQHPTFGFVQSAFEDYFIHHYALSSAVIRTNICRGNAGVPSRFEHISIAEAARLLRTTSRTIEILLKAGELSCQALELANKRKYRFVSRKEVLDLREKWHEAVSRAETAKYLGVTEEMVVGLVKVGLLAAEQNPADKYPHWSFGKSVLVDCLERVSKYVEDKTLQGRDGKSYFLDLAAASRQLFVVGLNAASILARVAGGKLPAYLETGQELKLGLLLFDRSDIQQCIQVIKLENGWMSREELAKQLKVKDVTLARWVRGGLISPVKAGGNAQYFDREMVEKFISDYVSTEEAAKILGVSKLTVQKWVRLGRLADVCVSGPGVDECHAYLFNKEKLVRWRKERLSFGEAVQLLGISKATLHLWIDEGKVKPLDDMGGKQRWFSKRDIAEISTGHMTLQTDKRGDS